MNWNTQIEKHGRFNADCGAVYPIHDTFGLDGTWV